MNRNELFTAILVAFADRGWAVPTGIECASLDVMRATLATATDVCEPCNGTGEVECSIGVETCGDCN